MCYFLAIVWQRCAGAQSCFSFCVKKWNQRKTSFKREQRVLLSCDLVLCQFTIMCKKSFYSAADLNWMHDCTVAYCHFCRICCCCCCGYIYLLTRSQARLPPVTCLKFSLWTVDIVSGLVSLNLLLTLFVLVFWMSFLSLFSIFLIWSAWASFRNTVT